VHSDTSSPQSCASKLKSPTPQHQQQKGGEAPVSATHHLQRAFLAADSEAQVWRERALDLAEDRERDKDQLERLMKFELSDAMKRAEDERTKICAEVEMEVRLLHADLHTHRNAALDAQQQIVEHQQKCCHLSDLVASRDATISSLQMELRDAQISNDASRAGLTRKDAEFAAMREQLDLTLSNLRQRCKAMEQNVLTMQTDRDLKSEASCKAEREAEMLTAQMEAALDLATAKQVELLAMERNTSKMCANQLDGPGQEGWRPLHLDDSLSSATVVDLSYGPALQSPSVTPSQAPALSPLPPAACPPSDLGGRRSPKVMLGVRP